MPNVSLWQIRKQQINKKILINQSVGEKKLTGFVCLFANKEKRNKNKGNREYFNDIYIYYSSELSSSDVERIISNRRKSLISIHGNARRFNADNNAADV